MPAKDSALDWRPCSPGTYRDFDPAARTPLAAAVPGAAGSAITRIRRRRSDRSAAQTNARAIEHGISPPPAHAQCAATALWNAQAAADARRLRARRLGKSRVSRD